jgi:hypothetical protein
MRIDNESTVSVPVDRAWEVLTDLEGVSLCLLRARLTGSSEVAPAPAPSPAPEPLDLTALAGGTMTKRVIPAVVALAVVVVFLIAR